jgi:hypothetical protein
MSSLEWVVVTRDKMTAMIEAGQTMCHFIVVTPEEKDKWFTNLPKNIYFGSMKDVEIKL